MGKMGRNSGNMNAGIDWLKKWQLCEECSKNLLI